MDDIAKHSTFEGIPKLFTKSYCKYHLRKKHDFSNPFANETQIIE